jgi:hypothetical protein
MGFILDQVFLIPDHEFIRLVLPIIFKIFLDWLEGIFIVKFKNLKIIYRLE